MVAEFVHEELSYRINGVLFDIHNQIGSGLKESTYQRAIAVGLKGANILFEEQVYYPMLYAGQVVGSSYFDFLIEKKIVLELKVGTYFNRANIQQVHTYLVQSNLQLGLLANFTHTGVKIKRVVNVPGQLSDQSVHL